MGGTDKHDSAGNDDKRKHRDKSHGAKGRKAKKHRADDAGRRATEPTTGDAGTGAHALSPMIQVNDYADMTRTSLIEVIDPDGRRRTTVAPVTTVPAALPEAPSPETAVLEPPRIEAADLEAAMSEAMAAQVAGLTAVAASEVISVAERTAALPDDQFLVRRQVGEALRDVAQALSKLADSLDPY